MVFAVKHLLNVVNMIYEHLQKRLYAILETEEQK